MSLIFLCGGQGKRFEEVSPLRKPCQNIFGRSMYKWVLESITNQGNVNNINVAAPDNDFGRSIVYDMQRFIGCPVQHTNIPYDTRGPIETAYFGIQNIINDGPFWVVDNDILYDRDIPWNKELDPEKIYIIIQELSQDERNTFKSGEYSPYGHVFLEDNKILNIIEKVYVSNYVVLGAYGFGSVSLYKKLFHTFIQNPEKTSQEWFMSSLIKTALDSNVTVEAVISNNSVSIGTPEQVQDAINKNILYPKCLRWVFDLDETLITLPAKFQDYTSVKPIQRMIDFVNNLYNNGHYIIIHTARGMRTHNGDLEKVKQALKTITVNTLNKFNIKYHELVFGKPIGDIYVDDKSTNPLYWRNNWIKPTFGFGWTIPENKGKIIKLDDTTCYKIAKKYEGLGNVYFVENCPSCIIPHIPKIYNVSTLEDERIKILMEWKEDSIPIGKLMAYEIMTDDIFEHILELMTKMHINGSSKLLMGTEIQHNVLSNYYPKFLLRYHECDIYNNLNINMTEIYNFFMINYSPTVCNCIHGDFWMSNMLWSHKEKKIYIIDMRGRLGNKLTIAGDKFYDYGKLCQSIFGFDSIIITGKRPSKELQNKLFNRLIIYLGLSENQIEDLKKVTALLILGSLPFHPELENSIDIIMDLLVELWPSIILPDYKEA